MKRGGYRTVPTEEELPTSLSSSGGARPGDTKVQKPSQAKDRPFKLSDYKLEDNDFTILTKEHIPYGSIILAMFLMCLGVASFVMAWLHVTQRILGKAQAEIGFSILGLLTFMPGAYHTWIAYCVWRGVPGYTWDMIPQTQRENSTDSRASRPDTQQRQARPPQPSSQRSGLTMHRHTHHADEEDGFHEDRPLLSSSVPGGTGGGSVSTSAHEDSPEGSNRLRSCFQSMQAAGKKFKTEVLALYLALLDPDCGWKARLMVVFTLCYALSPLDWIPELIPILALMVDFIVLPLLLWLCVKLMPPEVLEHARQKARNHELTLSRDWRLLLMVYGLWMLNVIVGIRILAKHMPESSYLHNHQLKIMAIVSISVTLLFVLFAWWRLSVEARESGEDIQTLLSSGRQRGGGEFGQGIGYSAVGTDPHSP